MTGLTTAQMQTASNFTGFNFTATPGATGNNWVMVDADGGLNNAGGSLGATRPMLASEYATTINNAHQLQLMGVNLSASYTLANNIDLAAELATPSGMWGGSSAGFVSIGSVGRQFAGSFDGLGHTISGITINQPLQSYVGLFGATATGSTISNVGLVNGSITGSSYSGGLVGRNSGAVSGSYASVGVTGDSYVGGLVGYMMIGGTISNSYSTGAVTGLRAAGLVGRNEGTINNSYASGAVTGDYSSGLTGLNDGGVVTHSFWNTETTGKASSTGGTGLTTAAMMQLASFSSWNAAAHNTIANTGSSGAVWRIYEGHTAPLLTSFMTSLVLSDASVTYNGTAKNGTTTSLSNVSGTGATGTNVGVFNNAYYSTQQGYDISGGNLTINAAAISLNGTRAYDGTFDVAASIFTLSGLVSGQNLTLMGSGTVADKNVGSNKTVTLGSLTLGDGSGGLASNYTFTGGTQTASITKADLSVTAAAVTKTYDSTLNASGSATIGTLAGATAGESVLSSGTQAFLDKNVGTGNKTIRASGVTIKDSGGVDVSSNYTIAYTDNTSSTISKADLALTGLTANAKVYDATTGATLGGTAAISKLGSDEVTLGGSAVGTFASKNVGSQSVSVSGNTLAGQDAGNYNLLQQTGLSATISKAQLSYTAAPANFLNGQTPNDLSGAVNGFATGDTLTNSTSGHLTWTTPANASSKPGSYAIAGNGLLASNYSFSQAAPNSTALTLAPATPPAPVLNATTQLASITTSPQASAQPTVLSMSPAITVTQSNSLETAGSSTGSSAKPDNVASANTSMTIGSTGPALQIVNGGMRLPVAMVNVNE